MNDRAALAAAAVALVIGLAWHTYTVRRADRDEQRRARLEVLRTLVSDVDHRAMSASFGLLPAYDDLVRALEALRTHAHALVADARRTPEEAPLQVILDRVEERARQVDDLKELRSTLTNSERLLSERLITDHATSPAAGEVRARLLAQRLVPNDEKAEETLRKARDALIALPDPDGKNRQLVTHIDVVLDTARRLTSLTRLLLERAPDSLHALVYARAIDQLAELDAHRREANVGRLASLAMALVLVVVALWLPDRRR